MPRRKIRINRDYRRTVRQKLILSNAELSEKLADMIDVEAKNIHREPFLKYPGTPLREAVKANLERRAELERKAFHLQQERPKNLEEMSQQ